jgi:hypothetical protein
VNKDSMSDGGPDIQKIDPIIYSGGNYWQMGKQVAKAFSVGKNYKK